MDITLKSPSEIEKMRIAGAATARVLEMIEPYVVPGVTTEELDNIMNDYIVNVENAKRAGMNAHLSKPINMNELARVLNRWLKY